MSTKNYSESATHWPAPLASEPIVASVAIPGSKSLTNRQLVLSALADGPSIIRGAPVSRDSELMISALRVLGAKFSFGEQHEVHITPTPLDQGGTIYCGLAGTVMRFLPPMAALSIQDVSFDADAQAYARPMSTTIQSLRSLGVSISGARLPFTVHGKGTVAGGSLELDASTSSQFVSGLLLSAPRFVNGLDLTHTGAQLPSLPHIDMTVEALQNRGVSVTKIGDTRWRVDPGPISGQDVQIEPDLSNAAPFLAAAALTGGQVTVPNWPTQTTQVGDLFPMILERMGARVRSDGKSLTVIGTGRLSGIDVDMSDCGELVPSVAAVAALAEGVTTIRGVAHLRGHETNRLAAIVTEINRVGGTAEELTDGVCITGTQMHAGTWHSYADHRMATMGAIIGLRVPGIEVEGIASTAKTLPAFAEMWTHMVGA